MIALLRNIIIMILLFLIIEQGISFSNSITPATSAVTTVIHPVIPPSTMRYHKIPNMMFSDKHPEKTHKSFLVSRTREAFTSTKSESELVGTEEECEQECDRLTNCDGFTYTTDRCFLNGATVDSLNHMVQSADSDVYVRLTKEERMQTSNPVILAQFDSTDGKRYTMYDETDEEIRCEDMFQKEIDDKPTCLSVTKETKQMTWPDHPTSSPLWSHIVFGTGNNGCYLENKIHFAYFNYPNPSTPVRKYKFCENV